MTERRAVEVCARCAEPVYADLLAEHVCTVVHPIPKPGPKHKACGDPACVSCRNRRNRRNGRDRQRRVAKKMGTAGAHEEQWRHPLFRVEVKSGGQVPKRVLDAFAQSDRAKADGDPRPAMTVWVPANSPRAIAVIALDDLNAALENQGPENAFRVRELLASIEKLAKEARELAR